MSKRKRNKRQQRAKQKAKRNRVRRNHHTHSEGDEKTYRVGEIASLLRIYDKLAEGVTDGT